MRNKSREAIDGACFKPTAGGFVFQAPRPWVFGETHNYLVNETQKSQILDVMTPDMPAWRRAVIIGALILSPLLWAVGISTLMWAISGHDEPTAGDVAAMILLIAMPILLALYIAVAWTAQVQLAKLAPLIAQLAPTDEQITAADRSRGMLRATSFRTILVIIVLWGVSALITAFALGMRATNHTFASASTALIVFNLLLPIVIIALYGNMALRKAEQGRDLRE